MIRFLCPTCDKRLSVTDDKAGKIAVCPGCQTRIIIPEAETAAESVTADPPLKRRATGDDDPPAAPLRRRQTEDDDDDQPPRRPRDDDDDDDRPRRRPAESDDDDDDIPEAELDRPRKRKKKRKKKKSSGFLVIGGFYIEPYVIVMAALLLVLLPLLALAFVVPGIAWITLVVGICMELSGRIWFLAVAFSDDSTQGILCMWLCLYSFVYLCINFEDTKRPFFLEVTGGFIGGFSWVLISQ